jgi:hypothetical protein
VVGQKLPGEDAPTFFGSRTTSALLSLPTALVVLG